MSDPKLEALDRRVHLLETRLRRGRYLNLATVLGFVVVLLLRGAGGDSPAALATSRIPPPSKFQPEPDGEDRENQLARISTPGIELVNRDGDRRARLEVMPDGQPALAFSNGWGDIPVILSAYENGAASLMFSKDVIRLSLGIEDDGQPALKLLDRHENIRVVLDSSEEDSRLAFQNAEGIVLGALMVSDQGGGLVLCDAEGHRLGALTAAEGISGLTLFNEKNQACLNILRDANGQPFVAFHDRNGQNRMLLDLTEDGRPGIAFYDAEGHNVAELGTSEKGTTGLGFFNAEGHTLGSFGPSPVNTAELTLCDQAGNLRFGVRTNPDGLTALEFYQEDQRRGSFALNPDGAVSLYLVGKDDRGGIRMQVAEDGTPQFQILDREGKTLFQIPEP